MPTIESTGKILVVEDEKRLWSLFPRLFRDEGWDLSFAVSAEEAIEQIKSPGAMDGFLAAIVDIGLPGVSGLDLLRWIRGIDTSLPVVILTSTADAQTAVTCMKAGAADFVSKPFQSKDLIQTVHRVAEVRRLMRPPPGMVLDEQIHYLMGPSDKIRQMTSKVLQVASTDMSVLIEGESGTGKEIVARRIRELSRRSSGPMIAVDCGAIPETLIESVLFGFKKGSFTGAVSDQEGTIRAAHGGTLFLDEVENLAPSTQVKLLRVLQSRVVTPIGTSRQIPVDVRLVSATNAPLGERIADGRFRLDLFHRIAEFPLRIPPLRERPDDVLYQAGRFLREASAEFGKVVDGFEQNVLVDLLRQPWPGNVRELRNVIRRAVLVSQGKIASLALETPQGSDPSGSDLTTTDDQIVISARAVLSTEAIRHGTVPFKAIRDRVMAEIEQGILRSVLNRLAGNKLQASKVLGLDYKTVHTKAKAMTDWRPSRGEEIKK